MHNRFCFLFVLFLFSNIAHAEDNTAIVNRFVDAFNNKAIENMLDEVDENIRWMSVAGDNITTETSDHSQLRTAMQDYFSSLPSARSKIQSIHTSGSFVYTLEQAYWTIDGRESSQCSMAIYELAASKIINVWYFSAHSC